MNIFLFASLFLFAVSGMFRLQHTVHMLQQNSYFPSRYFTWLKANLSFWKLFYVVLFAVVFGLHYIGAVHFLLPIAFIEALLSAAVWKNRQKTAIKKLVYTARVRRLLVTAGLLLAIFVALSTQLLKTERLWGNFLLLLAHFPTLLMLAAFYCNQPLEKTVAKFYLNQAKKILAQRPNLKVLGVTGSFGKTTVKTVLAQILKEKFNTVATPGSFNTPMGLVRTIREHLHPETEILIAEMGAKNVGDIAELCDICRPQCGIITAVGPQHLETFKTTENIQKTKFELAERCLAAKGKIYVNADSELALAAAKKLPPENVITYGTLPEADCKILNPVVQKNGCCFTLNYRNREINLASRLLGRHNMVNIAGAAAMALDLGVSEKQLRFAVSRLPQTPHRLELKSFYNGGILLDDAYNANPVGSLEAVQVLNSFENMKKIIVTPGLVELGEAEYESNAALGKAAAAVCDTLIFVGEKRAVPLKEGALSAGYPEEQIVVTKTLQEALNLLKDIVTNETVVLFENDLPDNYAG